MKLFEETQKTVYTDADGVEYDTPYQAAKSTVQKAIIEVFESESSYGNVEVHDAVDLVFWNYEKFYNMLVSLKELEDEAKRP